MNKHRQPRLNQKSVQKSLFFLLALGIAPLAFGQTPAAAPPDDAAVRERAKLLLEQMTLRRKDWVEEPTTFDVWVGGDSIAPLRANFNITY